VHSSSHKCDDAQVQTQNEMPDSKAMDGRRALPKAARRAPYRKYGVYCRQGAEAQDVRRRPLKAARRARSRMRSVYCTGHKERRGS